MQPLTFDNNLRHVPGPSTYSPGLDSLAAVATSRTAQIELKPHPVRSAVMTCACLASLLASCPRPWPWPSLPPPCLV